MSFLKKYTFRSIWIEIYLEGQIFFISVAKKYSCLMMVVSNLALVLMSFIYSFIHLVYSLMRYLLNAYYEPDT